MINRTVCGSWVQASVIAIADMDQLHANVPNPFNPSTIIRFDLPTAGPVERSVSSGVYICMAHTEEPSGS